jgi:hypothetical protein
VHHGTGVPEGEESIGSRLRQGHTIAFTDGMADGIHLVVLGSDIRKKPFRF